MGHQELSPYLQIESHSVVLEVRASFVEGTQYSLKDSSVIIKSIQKLYLRFEILHIKKPVLLFGEERLSVSYFAWLVYSKQKYMLCHVPNY